MRDGRGPVRELVLAALSALALAVLWFPQAFLAGQSLYATDAVLNAEPWRSELAAARPAYNPELGDWAFYVFPQLAAVQRHWHEHGELLLWNPGIYGGVPAEGNVQNALLYPFHWALALFQDGGAPFSPWRLSLGLTWMGIARFVLGAVFAWLWLRRLGGRWWTAALGTALVVAGPYASLWRWHTPEQVFSLMPLVLFGLEWLLQSGSKRALALFALALGVSNLGGYPQTSLFFVVFLAGYALVRAPRDGRRPRLLAVAAGIAVSLLLALPAWWPYLTYVGQSSFRVLRAGAGVHPPGFDWTSVVSWGSAALAVLGAAVWLARRRPHVGGLAAAGGIAGCALVLASLGGGDGQGVHWLLADWTGHPVRNVRFVGLPDAGRAYIEVNQDHVGLLVAAIVLAAGGGWRWALAAVLLVGSTFPFLYQGLRALVPLLEPSRAACLVPLLVAPGLVRALEHLLASESEQRATLLRRASGVVLAFLVPVAAFAFYKTGRLSFVVHDLVPVLVALLVVLRPPRAATGLTAIAILAVAHALAPGFRFAAAQSAADVYPRTPTIDFLIAEQAKDPDLRVFVPETDVLPLNALLTYGVALTLGTDGLEPRHYRDLLLNLPWPDQTWTVANLKLERPLFDLLASRLVVVRKGAPLPAHFRVVHQGPSLVVAENPRAAPRVYLTATSFVMQEQDLRAPDLLARPPQEHVGLDEAEQPALAGSPMTTGEAHLRARSPHELVIDTRADGAAWLVVLDGNLRGWQASVDGASVPIHKAFGAFRCLALPAGKHEVRFAYRPW